MDSAPSVHNTTSAGIVIAVDAAECGACDVDTLHAAAQCLGSWEEGGGFAWCAPSGELPQCATHLVREDTERWTFKTYFAAARGLPIVTPGWVLASLERGAWLLPDEYACSRLLGAAALGSATPRQPLLGERVCFFGQVLLPKATLEALVRAAGGAVERSHRMATVLLSDAPQPAAALARARARTCQPSKWLFERIERAVRSSDGTTLASKGAPAAEAAHDAAHAEIDSAAPRESESGDQQGRALRANASASRPAPSRHRAAKCTLGRAVRRCEHGSVSAVGVYAQDSEGAVSDDDGYADDLSDAY